MTNPNPLFGPRRHDAAHQRYESLVAAVTAIINATDPIGLLKLGAPSDEYSPEIGTIVPRVAKARTSDDVRLILHEEFEHWFGAGSAGPEEGYQAPAVAIWTAVLAFRQSTDTR